MEPSNSRLTLGYHLHGTHAGLGNLLGSDVQEFGVFLKSVSDASRTKVNAFSSSHPNAGIGSEKAVRIRIEGSLASLEQALNVIVEHEGIPDFVDQPVPQLAYSIPMIYGMLHFLSIGNVRPLLVKFKGPAHRSPTTPEAYDVAKKVYKKNRIETTGLADDTLALSSHGYI